jgi:hypothetical protein
VSFRILEAQMRALGHETQAAFVAKMESYVREHMPGFVGRVGHERIRSWIAGALAIAHAYDIDTEPEAAQLILLLTVLGLDADRQLDWVREVLEERMQPTGKLSKLVSEGSHRVPEMADVLVYPEYQQVFDRALAEETTS